MLKSFYISVMTCLCLFGQGQVLSFNSMGAKYVSNSEVRAACADNAGNVYIGGDFTTINGNTFIGIAKWNGTQWDSVSSGFRVLPQGNAGASGARALACYNNDIYAGGYFISVEGKPIRYIARWNGAQWDSLPQSPNAAVSQLVVCNGKLYAFGIFNKIGTISCNKMAVWDGTSWTPVWMPYYFDNIADICEYKGELYIGGNIFYGSVGGNIDLLKFDGSNWVPVGGGIKGGVSDVSSLRVFNNELYVGGYFSKAAGNAGENLMKWDGSQFKEVVAGLDAQINNITEVPDGLIVTGSFAEPFEGFFKISTQGVCGYFQSSNIGMLGAFYNNNKLYFYGGFPKINGDSTLAHICNVNYTTQTDSCQAFVSGIKTNENSSSVRVYPNPATSTLCIIDEQLELANATLKITNSIGQVVFEMPFANNIDISMLPRECYLLTITQQNGNVIRSKFIKQ